MDRFIDQHRDQIEALCRRSPVRRLDVFGSAARGDFDPASSDVDLLVELDELEPSAYAEAYFGLKSALERLLDLPVDLVTPTALANPYFRERVLAERALLYAR